MINANELRIGNWVNFIPDNVHHQVKVIDSIDWDEHEAAELEYIPISSEILEKCGLYYCMEGTCSERFKYQEGYWVLISSTIYLKDGGDGFSVETITYSHEESTEIAIIKYLHQLQNLYFSLTCEELNYTP